MLATQLRPPFPSVLDSTIIAAFRSCPQKANLEFIEHWKPRTPSVHLHAGAAYAAGLEAMRVAYYVHGAPPEEALESGLSALMSAYGDFECPPDSAKSLERTAGALEFYASRYPLGEDKAIPLTLPGGKRAIEFSFAEPLDLRHPESGDPIIYAGRMDMCCSYNGLSLGEDDKTASQLGASWPRQWDLRSQFTGYVWGAARAGIKLDGFLVRGVSILKTKYDTLEAITYRPEWQIERWETQLRRDVQRMIACWEEGYFDYNLDHACTEYGGCVMRQVCQMRQPMQLLQQQFQRRRWDPVTRTETVLGEDA
jgi:hypothetical protein